MSHTVQNRVDREGEQVILTLLVVLPSLPLVRNMNLGRNVRFSDEQGRGLYYDKNEWAEAPEEGMGLMLAIIQDPTKLHTFFQKQETT